MYIYYTTYILYTHTISFFKINFSGSVVRIPYKDTAYNFK